MKINIITLPAKTYISEMYPYNAKGIPTNSITHKQIPGCGITTFEIRFAKHHSIVVLPNVPVIKSKVKDHNKEFPKQEILGVHKGIDVYDIKVYLLKPITHKKILTTPEGFAKIIKAFEGNCETMLNDYFLLFDECERIITDVSYRGKIAAPFDIFFDFKNKALVSATTLPFSDERFADFEHYKIEPDFDYSKPLTVINTNNVVATLKTKIEELKSEHLYIFINSTNGIYAINNTLNIQSESKAYCAQESVAKLMVKNYMNASNELDVAEMAKYNFFTSRYFSAVDIKLKYQPDVIMITDIFFAEHSILDPHTEVIQIAGRFRNGVKSLTHITNFNPNMIVKTQQEALTYRLGCLDTYDSVVKMFESSSHEGSKDTLEFFVKNSPMANFYYKGKRNPFMIDNDLNEERVKGYYLNQENLKAAYDELTKHFTTTFKDEDHSVHDDDLYILSRCETKLERNKHLAGLLSRYTAKPGMNWLFLSLASEELKAYLIKKNPEVAEAVRLVGIKYLDRVGYDSKTLKKVIKDANEANELVRLAQQIHNEFEEDTFYFETEIVSTLTSIYNEHNIKGKPAASHINKFFHANRTTKHGPNGYMLKTMHQPLQIHEKYDFSSGKA